jgi:hypothetical protein
LRKYETHIYLSNHNIRRGDESKRVLAPGAHCGSTKQTGR